PPSNSPMERRAFSLIETLVVVAVVGIVGLAIHAVILRFYQANTYVLQGTAAVNSARNGVTTLSSNLREVTYGDDGAFPLGQAAQRSRHALLAPPGGHVRGGWRVPARAGGDLIHHVLCGRG